MTPLPGCELCHGDGEYPDRVEEYWGVRVRVWEPCPCLDREREEEPMEKIRYKILRDRANRPTVTICEITINGHMGKGIAIRSLSDNPVEKIGKIKAYGRAKKALYRLKDSLPVHRTEALESLSAVDPIGWPTYKSVYTEV